jgi:hypothetical protein
MRIIAGKPGTEFEGIPYRTKRPQGISCRDRLSRGRLERDAIRIQNGAVDSLIEGNTIEFEGPEPFPFTAGIALYGRVEGFVALLDGELFESDDQFYPVERARVFNNKVENADTAFVLDGACNNLLAGNNTKRNTSTLVLGLAGTSSYEVDLGDGFILDVTEYQGGTGANRLNGESHNIREFLFFGQQAVIDDGLIDCNGDGVVDSNFITGT